jgi:hypothetical protein
MTREEIKEEFSRLDLELVKAKADQHDRRMELQQMLNEIEAVEKVNLYQHLNKCFTSPEHKSYFKIVEVIPNVHYPEAEIIIVQDKENRLIKRGRYSLKDVLSKIPIELEEFNLAYSRCLIQINK